ncbi:sigma-54-dependent transcriptional regulator [Bacilliculturomica massiliensis]|uniref:sigma-54-dependent transcriptional regulator n=1 Tax=Bacilliculturomica massiliensis TaxID=1917867 RepID=UPI00102F623E|nr:sigma-54 dependent transcriptional regulator [Bacilliculturomica massiliensis]
MNNTNPILIIDDDVNLLKVYKKIFEVNHFNVLAYSDSMEALQAIRRSTVAVVISDIIMPRMDGMQLLREIKNEKPAIEVIMLTAEGSVSGAVDAVHQGAFTYMVKPVNIDELLFNVRRAYDIFAIREENSLLREHISELSEREPLIGNNIKMEDIRNQVRIVAPLDSTVLITGESGTGKEILANMIHYQSRRAPQPFVRVNCAALSENLLESELFGHEKGAFTGADRTRKGRFEMANRGTLLLDEIGELPPGTQAKLLRVLQEKEFERVGGSSTIKTDFRLIAATNRDLRREIENRRFREDLFYRINVVPIHIPPLRERKDDIRLLAEYFIMRICSDVKKPRIRLSERALEKLCRYDWPGNVRELRNIIERIVVLTDRDVIEEDMILLETTGSHSMINAVMDPASAWPGFKEAVRGMEGADLATARREFEKQYILRALDHNEWNVTRTALELNLARKNLYKKIKDYGIDLKW